MRLFIESAQYLFTVAATAKGNVYVNTARLDSKSVDALMEKHGYMVCLSCGYHKASQLFIMFSNSIPNSSSVFSVCFSRSGAHISMVLSMTMNWMS